MFAMFAITYLCVSLFNLQNNIVNIQANIIGN